MNGQTQIVSFKLSGKRIEGRLVSENALTAIVKPFIWIKMRAIKIHKKKVHLLMKVKLFRGVL